MMLFFAAAMALLAPAPEHYAMAMQPGFYAGNKQVAQNGSIEERIGTGETVDDWTRMITLITLNSSIDPQEYAGNFIHSVSSACPGTRATPPAAVTIGGHAGLEGRMECPLNPSTGKPETFFFRILSAGGRLHMLQIAFRHVPDANEIVWAKAQLAGATWCAAGSAEAICKS
jgi:hypothetical protein